MMRLSALLPLIALFACDPAQAPLPTADTGMPPTCIEADDPGVLQYQPLDECLASLLGCDTGGVYFEDECGCGCIEELPEECIDPLVEDVLQYQPLEDCLPGLVGCDTGGTYFEDSCGCGCLVE